MMNDQQMDKCKCHCHVYGMKCISWSAILAGALVGIGIAFLLNIFNVAIGLSAFPSTQDGVISLAVGGFVGMVIGVFVAMYIAGWVAGYLGRSACPRRNLGTLYGFITWCLALLLTVFMANSMGRYVNSYANFITNPATIVATTPGVETIVTPQMKSVMVMNFASNSTSIGIGAFVVFLLFFIGALGACFGGHYGMICRSDGTVCGCCGTKSC